MKTGVMLVLLLSLLFLNSLGAQSTLLKMDNIYPDELRIAGFELSSPQPVKIEATGVYQREEGYELIAGNCWILDAESREVIWSFKPVDYRMGRPDGQHQKDRIELGDGIYEVYYSTFSYYSNDNIWRNRHFPDNHGFFGTFFQWLFGDRHRWWWGRLDRELYRELKLEIKAEGKPLSKTEVFTNQEKVRQKTALSLIADRDDKYIYRGFILKKPAEIKVYCLGEAYRHENFDYGWILNTGNRRRVWELTYSNSEPAGGAEKNRLVRETISLPAGEYAVFYATDDSHSPQQWNSAPAFDAYFWGLIFWEVQPASAFQSHDFQPVDQDREILSLTGVRNSEVRSGGFSLKNPADLHLYAIGEGRDHEMYDYGWIVNAQTREIVWKMNYDVTVHAGGSSKNRLQDEIVSFPAGKYMAYFITDGSHSYQEWNADPPYGQQHYGLTVALGQDGVSLKDVDTFAEFEDPAVLARMIRVRDSEQVQDNFRLEEDSEVRIYALGEGWQGEMYDYAWITEKETGQVVWKMSYRLTDHAGGARKNRLFNNVVFLKKGDYEVYYRTDDSHSFEEWNDLPPNDPVSWGITIYRVSE
ncbi:MAG: hypothetical protein EH225_10685 [Calditrichaeota bacterium]|nr:hypothetical protein [Calditrichota bacterium]RQW00053.1 MAG: hypothetical protein EH225_10685 [Calditrichota bacterium]